MTLNATSGAPEDICACIEHRGPDSIGHRTVRGESWRAEMHFRRLAIVDLDERSDQPFGDARRGVLVYNGEIYNWHDLRNVLIERGVVFSTSGDTEVLYELLLQPDWTGLMDRVDGMFAFVLVLPSGELRFGRDRFGIKPLYVARDTSGSISAFASEIAPLRAAGLLGDVDPVAVAQGLFFLWTPPPRTGWQRCETVTPGIIYSTSPQRYATQAVLWRAPSPEAADDIGAAVRMSLSRQVQADVSVGLLLSGGLDSSWLALELAESGFHGPILVARTAAAADRATEPFEEDAPFAEQLANTLGLEVTWLNLDLNVLRQVGLLADMVEHPFGDPAALVLLGLCQQARSSATVLLSGVGVEELFLGYERYQAVQALQRLHPRARSAAARLGKVPLPRRYRERGDKFRRLLALDPVDWSWATQSYFGPKEWSQLAPNITLESLVTEHRATAAEVRDNGGSPLEAQAACDRKLFLPGLNLCYADRASMRASVELRVPFLSEAVASTALSVPSEQQLRLGDGKARFRAAARTAGVPAFVTKRSKTGFGAPVRTLLRVHGAKLWAEIGNAELFKDLVDRKVAETYFAQHVAGERERGLALYGLISAAVWWERHVTGQSSVAEALAAFEPMPSAATG